MLTLGDVKEERSILRVASYCPDSADFVDLVNKACRKLMTRGDFIGVLAPLYMCVRAGCVVWPHYVEAVRRIGWCGTDVRPMNLWGGFLPRGPQAPWRAGCHWDHGHNTMVSMGRTSVYQDILGDGRLVRAYARCNADFGKKIWIFGVDNNGQALQTDNGDGTWSMGKTLVLQAPYAVTDTYVRSIDYVLKELTQCAVNLYGYNPVSNLLEDLAQYEAGETRPSYERSRLTLAGPVCSTNGSCNKGVAALVKLRFVKARADTDPVLIDNLDALELEIQSIKLAEQHERAGALAYEADAVKELNLQLANDFPEETFTADNRIFADATFTNHCF